MIEFFFGEGCYKIPRASECELISVIDLRDAYHTLRLLTESQKYCDITPYYGSDTCPYQRLVMGLSVSPAIWQTIINKVLDEIPEKTLPSNYG